MGFFPKSNRVMPVVDVELKPLNPGTENDLPPKAIRAKVRRRKSKKGKGFWKLFTGFFAGILCATSTNAAPFKNSVAPESMYGNAGKPDSDSSDEETEVEEGQEDQPLARRGFQEVELAMAKQPEEGAETTPETRDTSTEAPQAPEPTAAKLTVPITELPKPNECSSSQETKTNNEIIQEFRDNGLVADLVVGKVKPNGVAFDIDLDNVRVRSKRPKTAKGFRVPKPPRRLERLEVKPSAVGEEDKLAKKIKEKQEKAALKKQELKEARLQKKREKLEKQQKAVKFVAAADDQKRKDAAEYIARQVERAKSARLLTTEDRLAKVEAAKQHREDVRSRCCCQECPDVDYDKISTYNGSSTNSTRRGSACSNEGSVEGDKSPSPPLYYKTLACLVPVERGENYDDFFDRPVGGGPEN